MLALNRYAIDLLSGKNRRRPYNLARFLHREPERRSGQERRSEGERRADWVTVGK